MKRRGARVRRLPPVIVLTGLVLGLLALTVVSAGSGQNHVPAGHVLGSVVHHLGLPWGPLPDQVGEDTLWQVRLPRVVMATLVGAALACAGAVMQGVFANPLAEPGIIGVSSGAAAASAFVIAVLGWGASVPGVAGAAFLGGIGTAALVYLAARHDGRASTVALVLTGIAINAIGGGVVALMIFLASPAAADQIVFWQLGSTASATWTADGIVLVFLLIGGAVCWWLAGSLDLLSVGEVTAGHLGVPVERIRWIALTAVAMLTAAAVAFTGIILFVGLVVPHLMRLLVGPRHRVLVPASALAGALLLQLADLGARTAVDYAELPIGMITALIGGPVFLVLLRRSGILQVRR